MTHITYTYDEEKATNKDYMIAALADEIDDGGATFDSMVEYNIDCPYTRNSDCYNEHFGNEYGTKEYKEGCVKCKTAWLERAYDTYPSDDGIWEIDE
jgi:hypothetical protein